MIPTIAAFAAKPTVTENVSFIVIGFLFVLAVLAILSILTALIGFICARLIKEPEPKKAKAPAPAAPATQTGGIKTDGDIPEHVIALIATATHVILKGRAQKIVSIRGSGQGWAQEGRREIFSSHRVR